MIYQCELFDWRGKRCRRWAIKTDGRGRWVCGRTHEGPAKSLRWPRNKPCPCGSGEKFKRCCEDAARTLARKAA